MATSSEGSENASSDWEIWTLTSGWRVTYGKEGGRGRERKLKVWGQLNGFESGFPLGTTLEKIQDHTWLERERRMGGRE